MTHESRPEEMNGIIIYNRLPRGLIDEETGRGLQAKLSQFRKLKAGREDPNRRLTHQVYGRTAASLHTALS